LAGCCHYFERSAIDSFLTSKGGKSKCPVAGCNKLLLKTLIRVDTRLEKKIIRFMKIADMSASQMQDNSELIV